MGEVIDTIKKEKIMSEVYDILKSAKESPETRKEKNISNCNYSARYYNGDFYIHVYFMLDTECLIDFNTVSSENLIDIEAIRVSENLQGKGIGNLLFGFLDASIEIINSLGMNEICKIIGELSIFESPYDEFEKSIPFYKKQAKTRNWEIFFYKFDEINCQEIKMNEKQIELFMKNKELNGRFEMIL